MLHHVHFIVPGASEIKLAINVKLMHMHIHNITILFVNVIKII